MSGAGSAQILEVILAPCFVILNCSIPSFFLLGKTAYTFFFTEHDRLCEIFHDSIFSSIPVDIVILCEICHLTIVLWLDNVIIMKICRCSY